MPPQATAHPRCAWAQGDPLMEAYHDAEWGRPERDGRALFEKLLLDGLQAGLSWRTILYRRQGMQQALDHFDPQVMAQYDDAKMSQLLRDARLIRNRLKVMALRSNARAYERHRAEGGDFSQLLWSFVHHTPVQHHRAHLTLAPTKSAASVAMSRALKALGFSFVGPTICYAFMQAVGMVNDHDILCPRHSPLGGR